MTFKSLLLSFLNVGAVTTTVIGGYSIFSTDKSNTTKSSDKDPNSKTEENQMTTPSQQVMPQINIEETPIPLPQRGQAPASPRTGTRN